MRKDYGKLVAEKLKEEGLKPVDGAGLRLAGFRGGDRVLVEFKENGTVLAYRRRNYISSVFLGRRRNSIIRLKRVYSAEKLAETLRRNGIEWIGFDEKDILFPVYDDAYPDREEHGADVLAYLRDQNTAGVKIHSAEATRWYLKSGLFIKRVFRHPLPGRFDCDNVDMKALVENMQKGNLKVLVRPRAFWMTRSYYGDRRPFYGDTPR